MHCSAAPALVGPLTLSVALTPDVVSGLAQNKYQAQRALQRNGMVSGHTMVGVRPLDKRFRSEALSLTSGEPAAPPPRSMALPLRPYRVDASSAQARSSCAGETGTLLLVHCSMITLLPDVDYQTT